MQSSGWSGLYKVAGITALLVFLLAVGDIVATMAGGLLVLFWYFATALRLFRLSRTA